MIKEKADHEISGSEGHIKQLPSLKNFADTRWGGICSMLNSVIANQSVITLLGVSAVSEKILRSFLVILIINIFLGFKTDPVPREQTGFAV